MSLDDFIDKFNSFYRESIKVLGKIEQKQENEIQRKIRRCSDEELRTMEKKISEEGEFVSVAPLIYGEMRRRHMV